MTTTPLGRELAAIIAGEGPIGIDRYMALALGHPRHGYYMTRDPLGLAGDFTTAPEISQMFGELVGLWAAHAWAASGRPSPIALVELGPGRGTLMADALRAIARAMPDFRDALSVHLVETSPALRERQAALLPAHRPTWHEAIDTLPGVPWIVIANEFFDALPVRQFVRRDGAWHERLVGLDGDRLAFGLAPVATSGLPDGPAGAILESAVCGAAIMAAIARHVAAGGGAALAIDYGHLETAFGDTLQAVQGHAFVDPLARPGEADLTCHVDFAALARTALGEGATVDLLATQADVLEALGIGERAAALARSAGPAGAAGIEAARHRLTDRAPLGMGSLFKVLAIGRRPV